VSRAGIPQAGLDYGAQVLQEDQMAIALMFSGAGVTQAQYDQVRKELHPDNKPPAGMLYHVAGATADGWRVVEVWDSQEAADRYFQTTLGAALQKAKITVQPDAFAVHNIMQP
jgi:quinol monooxygenase YgiN